MHRSLNTQENLHANKAEVSKSVADHRDCHGEQKKGVDSGSAQRGKNEREHFLVSAGRESKESREGRELKAYNEKKEHVLMYIDMAGLAFIAICTVYEGYQEWNQSYLGNFQYNVLPLACWYAGRAAQTFALIMLIFHVHGNNVGMFEIGGMYLLTIGPIINAFSAHCFRQTDDPRRTLNKKWIAVEVTELVGILLLDWSCVEVAEWFEFQILVVELVGYYIVALAALLEFDFGVGPAVPSELMYSYVYDVSPAWVSLIRLLPGTDQLLNVRWVLNFWRSLDAFGLLLLGVVATESYRMAQQEKREHKGRRPHVSSQKLMIDDEQYDSDDGKYDV